jgi:hypothetical protein
VRIAISINITIQVNLNLSSGYLYIYIENSKSIIINGKEFFIRHNPKSENPTKGCKIFNKLNSKNQKQKDQEKEQNIFLNIDKNFDEFEKWIEKEKNYIYLKTEETKKGKQ